MFPCGQTCSLCTLNFSKWFLQPYLLPIKENPVLIMVKFLYKDAISPHFLQKMAIFSIWWISQISTPEWSLMIGNHMLVKLPSIYIQIIPCHPCLDKDAHSMIEGIFSVDFKVQPVAILTSNTAQGCSDRSRMKIWVWTHERHLYLNGLVQERRNSIVNALELRLSYTNLSMCPS